MTYRNRISPSGRKTSTSARIVGEMTGKVAVAATIPNTPGSNVGLRASGVKLDQIEVEIGAAETLHLHMYVDTPATTAAKTPRVLLDLEQWNGTGYDAPTSIYDTSGDSDLAQAHSQIFVPAHTGTKVRLTSYVGQTSGAAINPAQTGSGGVKSDGVNFRLLALAR